MNLKEVNSLNCDLSEEEKVTLCKIMNKYDCELKNVDTILKLSNTYVINDLEYTFHIKKVKHDRYRISDIFTIFEELLKVESLNMEKYFKTSNDYLFIKSNKTYYYLTKHIRGTVCDFRQFDDVIKSIQLLAKLHTLSNSIDKKYICNLKVNLKNWPKIFSDNLDNLLKYKKIIERKKEKSEFDSIYFDYIEDMYNIGMLALVFLNNSDYYKLVGKCRNEKSLCYDGFYYDSVIKNNDTYEIINLENLSIDIVVSDLAKFIRKLMFKDEYCWNFEKAREVIEAYNEINKLTKEELEVMLALIIFPFKFLKLGTRRYIKEKDWSEEKYIRKLNKILHYKENKQKFVDNYLNYLQLYT